MGYLNRRQLENDNVAINVCTTDSHYNLLHPDLSNSSLGIEKEEMMMLLFFSSWHADLI